MQKDIPRFGSRSADDAPSCRPAGDGDGLASIVGILRSPAYVTIGPFSAIGTLVRIPYTMCR